MKKSSRNWTIEEDKILEQIMSETSDNKKLKWEEVAGKMHEKNGSCQKSGKQCRERWHNHLTPELNNSGEWKEEENEILFKYHGELGNKWAKIATYLTGRTDNCVKNHFYSTLRRGMRKVNNFIHECRKKKNSIKEFKADVLTKILIVADGDPEQKLTTKKNACILSKSIKENLIKVSLNEEENIENEKVLDNVIDLIMEFNKSCKKRKGKKKGPITDRNLSSNKDVENEDEEEEMSDESISVIEKPENAKSVKIVNKNIKNANQISEEPKKDTLHLNSEKEEVKEAEVPISGPIVGREENDMWNNLGDRVRKVSRAGSIENYFPPQEIFKNFGVGVAFGGSFYSVGGMEESNIDKNIFRSSGTNFIFATLDDPIAKEIFADSGIGLGDKRNSNLNFFNMSGTDEKNSFLNFGGDRGVLEPDDLVKSGEYEFDKGQINGGRLGNSNNSSGVLSHHGSIFSKSSQSNSMFKMVNPEGKNSKEFEEHNQEK